MERLSPLWPPPTSDHRLSDDGAEFGSINSDNEVLDELLWFLDEPMDAQQASPVGIEEALSTSSDARSDTSSSTQSPQPEQEQQLASPCAVAPRRSTQPRKARKPPTKRILDSLRAEAHQLAEELDRLREDAARTRSGAKDIAVAERVKRRRAEQECHALRGAIYSQTRFIRGLRSVFSAPPCMASSLNLRRYLHNYTRLPRDQSTRWIEYAALAQETRLLAATEILERETNSCESVAFASVSTPFIQTEMLPDRDGFSVTTLSVYALESKDVGTVLRGSCVAVRDILSKCQSYKCTGITRKIVDPGASSPVAPGASQPLLAGSNMMYRVMGIHHKSFRDDDELAVESRTVTLYKQTEDHAVMLWDFVDDDELHPIAATTDITRQAIGACVIRSERCDDGIERVVYRSLSTRTYKFHDQSRHEILQRFHHATGKTMRENELIFRGIMVDEVAKEEQAYQDALGRLGGK